MVFVLLALSSLLVQGFVVSRLPTGVQALTWCAWLVAVVMMQFWPSLSQLFADAGLHFLASELGVVDASITPAKKRRPQDPPELEWRGDKITLPENPNMKLKDAVNWLAKMAAEQDQLVVVQETIDVYPWDGARAFMLAIKQRYGFAKSETEFGFFGANPPKMLSVKTDVGVTEQVLWGKVSVPGIEGNLWTGSTTNETGQMIFMVRAEVPKRQSQIVADLAQLTREILQTHSIYRGKALRFSVKEGEQQPPTFVDLSRVNPEELVYSADIASQIETTVFAPLRRREWCKVLGIPFKRGVTALGPYGTGKTLMIYVAMQIAKASGITSIIVEDAEQLPAAMLFARQYAPALLVVEDIDRVTRQRDELCNDIMDALDGVEAKEAEVMVLFTTNNANEIHEAMRRPGRIDTFIKIDPPDAPAVEKLIRLYGRGLVDATEDVREACRLLAGQIPAVVREVVERAKLAAVATAETLDDARHINGNNLVTAAKRLLMQQQLFAPVSENPNVNLVTAVRTLGEHLSLTAPVAQLDATVEISGEDCDIVGTVTPRRNGANGHASYRV